MKSDRLFRFILLAISVLVILCLFFHLVIAAEELNIKQIERTNIELVKLQEIEKLEYYKTLNAIY